MLVVKLSLIFCLTLLNTSINCQTDDDNIKGGGRGKSEITTLDGVFYRFNGNGEYTFMEIDSIKFTSQIRMTPYVNSNGLKRKLSVITALAIKNDKMDSVQIELNQKNEKLDVLVNGKDFNYYDDVQTVNIRVFSDNIILEYFNGITFAIKANKNYNALLVVVTVSNEYKGKTRGLLGNMDDNTENEFTTPRGVIMNLNSVDDKSLYSFGEQWKTTSVSSIFTYKTPQTHSSFIDSTFVPKFVVDGISFEDQSLVAPAIAFCNEKQMEMSRCLFDISVTGEVTNDSVDFDDPTARCFFGIFRPIFRIFVIIIKIVPATTTTIRTTALQIITTTSSSIVTQTTTNPLGSISGLAFIIPPIKSQPEFFPFATCPTNQQCRVNIDQLKTLVNSLGDPYAILSRFSIAFTVFFNTFDQNFDGLVTYQELSNSWDLSWAYASRIIQPIRSVTAPPFVYVPSVFVIEPPNFANFSRFANQNSPLPSNWFLNLQGLKNNIQSVGGPTAALVNNNNVINNIFSLYDTDFNNNIIYAEYETNWKIAFAYATRFI
jgi:hypothetical protein